MRDTRMMIDMPPILLPRAAAIVAWLCAHQAEIESIPNGQLLLDWGGVQIKARLTRAEAITTDPARCAK